MSRLRQVTRQVLVYLSTLSLGITTFYRTFIKKLFTHTFCVKFYLLEGRGGSVSSVSRKCYQKFNLLFVIFNARELSVNRKDL